MRDSKEGEFSSVLLFPSVYLFESKDCHVYYISKLSYCSKVNMFILFTPVVLLVRNLAFKSLSCATLTTGKMNVLQNLDINPNSLENTSRAKPLP